MEAMPKTAPAKPWYFGRFLSGTKSVMITEAPTRFPAPPKPVMARPIMSAVDVGAAAHKVEPISKMTTSTKNVHFAG